jgi:hypothetical protein
LENEILWAARLAVVNFRFLYKAIKFGVNRKALMDKLLIVDLRSKRVASVEQVDSHGLCSGMLPYTIMTACAVFF